MSRCIACDKKLSAFESTRKTINELGNFRYLDLCNACFKESGLSKEIPVIERTDLPRDIDIDEEECSNNEFISSGW